MGDRKHNRDNFEGGEIGMEDGSSCKRFRRLTPEEEELIHMLEDVEEEPHIVVDEEVLCGVMRSLEAEITSSCCSTDNIPLAASENRSCDVEGLRKEMGYLLSASDDELGIPPGASVKEAVSCVSESRADIRWFRNEGVVDALWNFKDYNRNLLEWVGDEYILYEERDFSLFEANLAWNDLSV